MQSEMSKNPNQQRCRIQGTTRTEGETAVPAGHAPKLGGGADVLRGGLGPGCFARTSLARVHFTQPLPSPKNCNTVIVILSRQSLILGLISGDQSGSPKKGWDM